MKVQPSHRPFVRRRAESADSATSRRSRLQPNAPVFQPLEPRKLLTTLVAFPDSGAYGIPVGETNIFEGFIAMPALYKGQDLDAGSVEERSVRVRIVITDSDPRLPDNPLDRPTVTILDLNGNPLFPWLGQEDGSTDVEVSLATGDPDGDDDGYWGTDDDLTIGGFGLDVGYTPGYHFIESDRDGDGMIDVPPDGSEMIAPNAYLYPVRVLSRIEDPDNEDEYIWDEENVPDDRTLVIPGSGYWHLVYDNGGNLIEQFRLPFDYEDAEGHPEWGAIPETDDRLMGTADDPVVPDDWFDPEIERLDQAGQWAHMITRAINPDLDSAIDSYYNAQSSTRQRHTSGIADDGIADFNNGIGRIIVSNAKSTTTITLSVIDDNGEVLLPFALPNSSEVGIDFDRDLFGNPFPYGDPDILQQPGMGQIIVGNNTNADWTANAINGDPLTPNGTYGFPWQNFSFEYDADYPNRLPEGIWFATPTVTVNVPFHPDFPNRYRRPDYIDDPLFVQDDTDEVMGRISIDGALFGVSRFPGALEMLHVGFLGGIVQADGEVDSILVAGDAGYIDYTAGYTDDANNFLDIGRNLGSFVTGNRNSTEVFVEGDLVDVVNRPPVRENAAVLEHERRYEDFELQDYANFFPTGEDFQYDGFPASYAKYTVGFTLNGIDSDSADIITNHSFATAQYIGRVTSHTNVYGDLGATDHIGRDNVDMYAVAVDGQSEITVSLFYLGSLTDYPQTTLTIQDEMGRVLASRGVDGTTGSVVYTPSESGLVYIVLEDEDGAVPPGLDYHLAVSGFEDTTLGEVRTLGLLQYSIVNLGAITTNVGDIGTVRVGQSADDTANAYMSSVAISSAENLWNVTVGHAIGGFDGEDGLEGHAEVFLTAEKNIGSIIVGVGQADTGGDERLGGSILLTTINAGEDIGKIWAMGNAQDYGDIGGISYAERTEEVRANVDITAGGSIGVIHADNRIYGRNELVGIGLMVDVSQDGVIDLISAGAILHDTEIDSNRDLTAIRGELGIVGNQLEINTGTGGNVRFVRAPHVYGQGFEGSDTVFTPEDILDHKIYHGVDDSGAEYTIEVTPGQAAGGFTNSSFRVVTQPVANSQGTALVRLVVNLQPGADLIITNNSGHLEIGDIIVMGSEGDTGQEIKFVGKGQTDVYYLRAVGVFKSIINSTSGDMVAIDTRSAGDIDFAGDLGRTDSIAIGPRLLGPDLGLELVSSPSDPSGEVASVDDRLLFVNGSGMDFGWTIGGQLELNTQGLMGNGSNPFDAFLNGLSVRSTNYNVRPDRIHVDGMTGDVIVQNTIDELIINADKKTPFGEFHGLVGQVYANGNIDLIKLGDGMQTPVIGPRPETSLVALGQIERIEVEGEGHDITGYIFGVGIQTYGIHQQNTDFGIGRIQTKNGSNIINARISGQTYDSYWGDTSGPRAAIDRIFVRDGNMLDTVVRAVTLERIDIRGVWDHNTVRVSEDINKIVADSFTNTTGTGAIENWVEASGTVKSIETRSGKGDMVDFGIDLLGNIDKIKAFNMSEVIVEVDQTVKLIDAKGRIEQSYITTGSLTKLQAAEDIARVTVKTSGPIKQFKSRSGSVTLIDLEVGGPDGRLDNFDAAEGISGQIVVAGPIKKIKTKNGDISASITTTEEGDVNQICAARDFIGEIDIAGNIDKFKAGRNIGQGEGIIVHGDLGTMDAKKGTINAQINVKGSLTKAFQTLHFEAGAALAVLGSINKVDIDSDLDASIVSHSNGIKNVDIDGSVLDGGLIAAYDGDLDKVSIKGDFGGAIFSDETIKSVDIRSAAGSNGDFTGTIDSMGVISKVTIAGDATDSRVHAMLSLDNLTVQGSDDGSLFGAGLEVKKISISGDAANTVFVSGVYSLGEDGVLGGGGLNADIYGEGSITNVTINGGIQDTVFAAGVTATEGDEALFELATELPAAGLSEVDKVTVNGTATGTNLFLADTAFGKISVDGTERTVDNPGVGVAMEVVDTADPDTTGFTQFNKTQSQTFTESDGDQVTLSMSGDGQGWFLFPEAGNLTDLVLLDTGTNTTVQVLVTGGNGDGLVQLDDVAIVTNDDASLNQLILEANLDGADSVMIDGQVKSLLSAALVDTTGTVTIGSDVGRISVDSVAAGTFNVQYAGTFETTDGDFSGAWISRETNSFKVQGDVLDGSIYGRDELSSVSISGMFGYDPVGPEMYTAYASTRGRLGSFTADSTALAIISAGDTLGKLNINGQVYLTDILAGLSLGSDGNYGGTGTAADSLTNGIVENVTVKGDFVQSNVAAGVTRGTDEFYSSDDDIGVLGISEIKHVSINGEAQGTDFGSESYGFTSNGLIDSVKVSGKEFYAQLNMARSDVDVSPDPVRIISHKPRLEASTYYYDLYFNVDIDVSSIVPDPYDPQITAIYILDPDGLEVSTVNYDITYDETERRASVEFERSFTDDNTGTYTIVVDSNALRSVAGLHLDGDGDGVTGDDFMSNFILSDAGDRLFESETDWDPDDNPGTDNDVHFMDPVSLDELLDDPAVDGLLARRNYEIQIADAVGNHPDHESVYFPDRMDTDVYSVTLSAGEFFVASLTENMPGSEFFGIMTLRQEIMGVWVPVAVYSSVYVDLPRESWPLPALDAGYFITLDGVYQLEITGMTMQSGAVGSPPFIDVDFTDTDGVNMMGFPINPDSIANDLGTYELNVMVFDDGDSGFDRGQYVDLITGESLTSPDYIGPEGTNGYPEHTFYDGDVFDISEVRIDPGADGIWRTADDEITTELEEGTTVTITVAVEDSGSNMGTIADVGLFKLADLPSLNGGSLVAAPGYDGLNAEVTDMTFTVQIPETGRYAVMVQGGINNNYELIVNVDTSTQGTYETQDHQNVLIELDGSFADWNGRFGTELDAFDLSDLGFSEWENEILSLIKQGVEDNFNDIGGAGTYQGVDIRVSYSSADFGHEEFTTVFLANNTGEENFYGYLPSSNSGIDPLNESQTDEAIVFVNSFAGFFVPGMYEELAMALSDQISNELAHTFGLRNASDPMNPNMMGSFNPYADRFFLAQEAPLGDNWMFGTEDEGQVLDWIFDFKDFS